jgi:hypothetical protein
MLFYGTGHTEPNGDWVIDGGGDQWCGNALVLTRHVVTQNDAARGEWHILQAVLSVNLLILMVLKSHTIPQGIMTQEMNIPAQYMRSTGAVASTTVPAVKAVIDMSIANPGVMKRSSFPVVSAAHRPEMATGTK